MRRHLVLLAAFFVQAYPPALALRVVVVDVHVQRGRDPGEAVDQQRDQRAVAQPDIGRDVDAVDQLARFVAVEDRRLFPFLTIWLGPRTGAAGFWSTTWPTISQSNSRRIAARCCLTVGAL